MNKYFPVFYDGRDLDKVVKQVEESQKSNKVKVVSPPNVDLSNNPKFPYYPYE
jgi:hypothetical protein